MTVHAFIRYDNGEYGGETAIAPLDTGEHPMASIDFVEPMDGVECAGPLSWCNRATLHVNPGDDSVTCVVSIEDPRGGFGFTVRRLPDGRIVIHVPHAGESTPHAPTRDLHPGTIVVTHDDGTPRRFIDPPTCDECGSVLTDLGGGVRATVCDDCGHDHAEGTDDE